MVERSLKAKLPRNRLKKAFRGYIDVKVAFRCANEFADCSSNRTRRPTGALRHLA
jgi:hypothetical protein